MQRSDPAPGFDASPFAAAISAAIFGYLGFLAGLSTEDASGPVALWIAFLWSMRLGCVAFALSAALAFARDRRARIASGALGMLAAVALLAIAVWDLADGAHAAAMNGWILLLVAGWNGFESFSALRAARA